jgi:hypothetical protein
MSNELTKTPYSSQKEEENKEMFEAMKEQEMFEVALRFGGVVTSIIFFNF